MADKKINELREESAALLVQAEDIISTADKEERALTDEESKKHTELIDKAEALADTIERRRRAMSVADKLGPKVEATRDFAVARDTGELDPLPEIEAGQQPSPDWWVRMRTGKRFCFPKTEQGDREALAFANLMTAALNPGRAEGRKALEYLKRNAAAARFSDAEVRVMSENVNSAGGALVPAAVNARIIDLKEQYGVFRQNVFVMPMDTDSLTFARRTGGLTAYAVGEGQTITASDGSWNNVSLNPKKWAALSRWSTELGEDAMISLADWLAAEIAYCFVTAEDDAGFLGDGTSTYNSIYGVFPKIDDTTHTASIYTALAGNTAFSTLDLVDFEGAVGQLPMYPGIQPKWYISKPGFYASMARLMDAAGGNTKDDVAGGTGLQFLGYPVALCNRLNSTLTAQVSTVVCVFGDLGMAATMGERRGTTIATSSEVYFTTDELAIKGTQRYDINVHDLGDTSSAGPLIGLKTPGA